MCSSTQCEHYNFWSEKKITMSRQKFLSAWENTTEQNKTIGLKILKALHFLGLHANTRSFVFLLTVTREYQLGVIVVPALLVSLTVLILFIIFILLCCNQRERTRVRTPTQYQTHQHTTNETHTQRNHNNNRHPHHRHHLQGIDGTLILVYSFCEIFLSA